MRFRRYRIIRRSEWDPAIHHCHLPGIGHGFGHGAVIECPCGQQWRLAQEGPDQPLRWNKYQRPEETG